MTGGRRATPFGRGTDIKGNGDGGTAVWVDPDDAPELAEAHFDRADVYDGEVLVRRGRGRPPATDRKHLVSLRLDRDVIGKFKATGPGWQTRINEVLRLARLG